MKGSENSKDLTASIFISISFTLKKKSTILPWKQDTKQNIPSSIDRLAKNETIPWFGPSNHQFLYTDCE